MWLKSSGPNQRLWLVCGVLALCVKLALAINTIGTNDVVTWHWFANSIDAHGPLWLYHSDPLFNHPPFMSRVLTVINWLAHHTAFGFPFWLRLPAILADFGSLCLVALIVQPNVWLLTLLAICPISILVSGFHGNTDPVMIFLILLSIYFLERRKWLLAAAVTLGLAGCIKIVAVVLAPAFVFYLESNRQRILFALTACSTFVLLSSPYLIQDSGVIVHNVFGYRSDEGFWVISRLLRTLEYVTHHIGYLAVFDSINLIVTALVITGFVLLLSRRHVSLYGLCAISMFLFLWLIPGFGVQYLTWLVPFALFFGEAWTIAIYASSGLFLFLVYNYWSDVLPWYYAYSGGRIWPHGVIPFELATWLIIGLTLCAFLWRFGKGGSFDESAAGA